MSSIMDSRSNSIGFLINQAARLTHKMMRAQLGSDGPHPAYLSVLLALYECDRQTQAELARQAGIEQPSMAELLKRMTRDGYIAGVRDKSDGRRTLISLTERAKEAAPALQRWLEENNQFLASGISARDLLVFRNVLSSIIKNLETSDLR